MLWRSTGGGNEASKTPLAVSVVSMLLALLVLSCANIAYAGPCEALERLSQNGTLTAEQNAEDSNRSPWARLLGALWGENHEQFSTDNDTEPELYFTSKSGFSVRPVCEKYGPRYRAYLYYPIGLVVRKLDVEELAPGREFFLVEAEHGLRTFVKPAHLAPLEDDKTYFFSDSLDFYPYCRTKDDCTSTDKENRKNDKRALHPTLRYAVANRSLTECEGVEIALYGRGHERLLRSDGSMPSAYLDACIESEIEAGDFSPPQQKTDWHPSLKIVTRRDYEKLFATRIRGHYQRFSDAILQQIWPGKTSVKYCSESSIQEVRKRLSIDADANVNISVLDVSGGGGFERITKRINSIGKGVYIFYSSYVLDTIDDRIIKTSNPIEAIFKCDDRPEGENLIPESLYMVNVHNPLLEGEEFSVEVSKLVAVLKAANIEDNHIEGDYAGLALASLDGRKLGQYWKIKGYFEYFRLRDSLRRFLKDETQVSTLVEFDAPEYIRRRNLDYFVHVVMAATAEPSPRR